MACFRNNKIFRRNLDTTDFPRNDMKLILRNHVKLFDHFPARYTSTQESWNSYQLLRNREKLDKLKNMKIHCCKR